MEMTRAAVRVRAVPTRRPRPYWEVDRYEDFTEAMGTDASADVSLPSLEKSTGYENLVLISGHGHGYAQQAQFAAAALPSNVLVTIYLGHQHYLARAPEISLAGRERVATVATQSLYWRHVTGELIYDIASPASTSTTGSVALRAPTDVSSDAMYASRWAASSFQSVTPWNVVLGSPAFVPTIESVPRIPPIQAIKELPGIGEQIGRRLEQLEEILKDDGEKAISQASLESFLAALRSYANLKLPKITLTPDNNIYAAWRDGSGRVFSAHFLPENSVRFVILRPDPVDEPHEIRSTGTVPANRLFGVNETSAATWVFL